MSVRTDLVTRRDLTATVAEDLVAVFAFVIAVTGGGIAWFAAASAIVSVAAVEGGVVSDEDEVMFGVEIEVEGLMVTAETVDDSPLAAGLSSAR